MANSTVDGSVVINVNMNVSDAEKELAKLKKKIKNIEAQIKKTELKRQEANQKAIFGASELDAEKAKLQEIKDRLSDIKAMAKDKSLGQNERDNAKALIASVQAEYSEQRERVRGLQTEYNKVANSVDRYDQKLKDLNNDLEVQKVAAGGMEQEIAAGNERFRQMAEEAGIADQHIIELNKELSELKSRQAELETAGIGLGYAEYDQNAARIAEITKELKEYQKALADASFAEKSAMPDNQKADRSANSQRRMNAYLEKSSSIYQKLSSMIGKTTQMSGVLQDIASTTGGKFSGAFQSASKAVDGLGTAFSGVLTKIAPVLAIASAVIAVVKKIWSAMKEFAAGFTNAIKRGAAAVYSFGTAVAKNFVSALKAIGRFSGAAAKAIFGITKKFIHFAKQFNVFSHMSEAISGTFKQLGNTIKSALVFSVIYQGLSLIRQQVGAYLSVNTELTTALRRLQGALLTAFQPIYEVVVPALTTLINILTRAAATVTQFFASLFGTTAKQAQTNAKDLYEQANATTALGEAAEEAAGSLAGFDEINQIQTENKSGGGGGSSSSDNGPLFDYEYDETPFDSWGEAFSAFLDKLLDGIPKLEDAFKKFADWLNDFSKNLYEMFTFPGVLEKVKQLGTDLAAAFEHLADLIEWEQLGRALGAGLNLAIAFLNGFIYGGDSADDSQWKRLGKHLSDAINGLVDEIQWYEFGRLLWGGFKIGLETLAGILENLNIPALANAASNIIMGFFDEMENTINRISWSKIGTQIAIFLNEFQWYEALTSVFTAISAGIMGLKALVDSFLANLKWPEITDQISRAINEAIGLVSWEGIGETIGNCFKTAFAFAKALISKIQWYEIGQSIADFILGFDFVGALGGLADLIAEGINAAIKLARGFLDKILPEVQGIAEGIADRLRQAVSSVKWDELGGVIGDGVKTALSFVAGLLDPELFYEVGKAIGDFLINLNWSEIVGGLANVLANGINSAVALVKGFLSSVQPNLKEIAEDIAQKINEFVETVDWEDLGRTIHDGIEAALNFLITILDNLNWDEIGQAVVDFLSGLNWGELLREWGDVVGKALGGAMKGIDLGDVLWLGNSIIDGIWRGMLNKWDESGGIIGWIKRKLFEPFVNGFKSLFGIHSPSTVMEEQGEFLIDGLLQGITNTWSGIVDFFKEKVEAIQDFFSGAWDAIKETASSAWETIKETLSGIWDSIKEKAVEIYTAIKDKITEVWNSIKETASTVWEAIKTTVTGIWDGLKTAATTAFNAVKDAVVDAWEAIKTTTKSIWDGIWNTIKGVINSILGGVESMVNGVIRALNKMISALNSLHVDVPDWVPAIGGKYLGFNIPSISEINIPRLARGAVIPPNREFLAVLGDQRSGNNIEAPEELLRRIAREENGNGEVIALLQAILEATRAGKTIMVDRKVLGQTVTDEQNRRTRATGRPVVLN